LSATGALRANRNFRLLWIGQVLSDLGTQMGSLAYPLLVLALSHSALVAGAVGTAASVAAFAVRLPAGALADRVDRRRTMILVDGGRTVALAVLAALVATHAVAWPVVLAVAVVDRGGDTLFTPASMAALPLIVADEQLESAWAVSEGRQYGANLVGPAPRRSPLRAGTGSALRGGRGLVRDLGAHVA
jgi:MFS family permease